MHRIALMTGVVAAAALSCGTQAPEKTERETLVEPDTMSAFLTLYLDAIATGDTASLRKLYVDDARFVWIEDGAVRYRTPEDVFEGLGAFPSGTEIQTELEGMEVVRLGTTGAHAWALFTTRVGEGSGAYVFGGAVSFLLEQDEGGWRIVGGHVSSPRDR